MGAPEYIEVAVALGTFALAFVTWRMAVATRQMANSAEEQMELLRDRSGRMPPTG